jgi:hypothetical protein
MQQDTAGRKPRVADREFTAAAPFAAEKVLCDTDRDIPL